jgi:diketogulonate reductase-like aldo/keto reductase
MLTVQPKEHHMTASTPPSTPPAIPRINSHGAEIPVIGLGTWTLADDACTALVAGAVQAGYRHVDTAVAYGNEAAVGAGLRQSGVPRDAVFVTTKVWHDQIGAGQLQASAEASLQRLGLDVVDLLLIHWPNPAIPLKDSIAALCDAKRRGLTRHIGVSNFTVPLLDQAMQLTSEPLVVNQCEFHPHLDAAKVRAACARHNVAFVAYTPLGRGAIGGVLDEPVVKQIAARLARTPAQVVLRWHLQQGIIAIPRTGNLGRAAQNLAVFDFVLASADMAALSALTRPDGRVVKVAFAPAWD